MNKMLGWACFVGAKSETLLKAIYVVSMEVFLRLAKGESLSWVWWSVSRWTGNLSNTVWEAVTRGALCKVNLGKTPKTKSSPKFVLGLLAT